jgi:hypothetical protein
MTITYHVDKRKHVIGNVRMNTGFFTLSSAEVTAYVDTGLRMVDRPLTLKVQQSGGIAICTYPTGSSGDYPTLNSTSGHFTVVFTSTAGPVYWEAFGKV